MDPSFFFKTKWRLRGLCKALALQKDLVFCELGKKNGKWLLLLACWCVSLMYWDALESLVACTTPLTWWWWPRQALRLHCLRHPCSALLTRLEWRRRKYFAVECACFFGRMLIYTLCRCWKLATTGCSCRGVIREKKIKRLALLWLIPVDNR